MKKLGIESHLMHKALRYEEGRPTEALWVVPRAAEGQKDKELAIECDSPSW